MQGLLVMEELQEPRRRLDVGNLHGCKVALKMTGGVGDVLMTVGASAQELASRGAVCTAVVREHHREVAEALVGVFDSVGAIEFNRLEVRSRHDVVIDFAGTFNSPRQFRVGRYYDLVAARLGLPVTVGRFKFERAEPIERVVALHPWASNPSRRWPTSAWRELAYCLRDRDCSVVWLGMMDEYGFSDDGVYKLSDQNEKLLWQIAQLAKCAYFIGNDSGFAHAAGLLGVPGLVLFSVTDPDAVIGHYSSLKPVSKFVELGVRPSLSLAADDPVGMKVMQYLSPEDVLEQFELDSEIPEQKPRNPVEGRRMILGVVGANQVPGEFCTSLRDTYEVKWFPTMPTGMEGCDVLLVFRDGGAANLLLRGGQLAAVRCDFESVARSLRELRAQGRICE